MMTVNIQFSQHTMKASSGSAPAFLGIQKVTELPPLRPQVHPSDSRSVPRGQATQHVRRGPIRRLGHSGLGPGAKAFLNPKREEVESEPGRKAMLRIQSQQVSTSLLQASLPAFPMPGVPRRNGSWG